MQIYDFVMAGIMYVISGVMFWQMKGIQAEDSKVLPTAIAVALIGLGTMLIISRLKKGKEDSYDFKNTSKGIIVLSILCVFILCSNLFGFYVCTPFFLVAMMWTLGQRSKKAYVLVPILTTAGVVIIFHFIFQIPMPEGTVFNLIELLR